MNKEQLAWVAGLLEGEGSFLITQSNTLKVQCAMTDKDVLDRLHEYVGQGKMYSASKAKEYYKDIWTWHLAGEKAKELMLAVRPYMLSRRQSQIDFVLEKRAAKQAEIDAKLAGREEVGYTAAREYLATSQSYRQLEKKYNISFVTIKNYVDKLK